MRCEEKVTLEVKEILDYIGVDYDKWLLHCDSHEAHFRDQSEDEVN